MGTSVQPSTSFFTSVSNSLNNFTLKAGRLFTEIGSHTIVWICNLPSNLQSIDRTRLITYSAANLAVLFATSKIAAKKINEMIDKDTRISDPSTKTKLKLAANGSLVAVSSYSLSALISRIRHVSLNQSSLFLISAGTLTLHFLLFRKTLYDSPPSTDPNTNSEEKDEKTEDKGFQTPPASPKEKAKTTKQHKTNQRVEIPKIKRSSLEKPILENPNDDQDSDDSSELPLPKIPTKTENGENKDQLKSGQEKRPTLGTNSNPPITPSQLTQKLQKPNQGLNSNTTTPTQQTNQNKPSRQNNSPNTTTPTQQTNQNNPLRPSNSSNTTTPPQLFPQKLQRPSNDLNLTPPTQQINQNKPSRQSNDLNTSTPTQPFTQKLLKPSNELSTPISQSPLSGKEIPRLILPSTPQPSLEPLSSPRSPTLAKKDEPTSLERKKIQEKLKDKKLSGNLSPRERVNDHETTWEKPTTPKNGNSTLSSSPRSPRLFQFFNKTPSSPKPSKEEKIREKEEKIKREKEEKLKEKEEKRLKEEKIKREKEEKIKRKKEEKEKVKKVEILNNDLNLIITQLSKTKSNEQAYDELENKRKEVVQELQQLLSPRSLQKLTNDPLTSTNSISSPLTTNNETGITKDEKKTDNPTDEKKDK